MLKKSASGVLASFRGSTYRSVRLDASFAAALLGTRRVSARQGWVGEKAGLFEHPARCSPVVLDVQAIEFPPWPQEFFRSQLESPHDLSLPGSWLSLARIVHDGSSRNR
jgi:hypothetical protein